MVHWQTREDMATGEVLDAGGAEAGIAGLHIRPCAALVPNPVLCGSQAERTGTAPMDPTVAPVCGRCRHDALVRGGRQLVRCGTATFAPAAPAPRPSLRNQFSSSGLWPVACCIVPVFQSCGGGGGGSVCRVLRALVGRLGEPYVGPTRAETGQGYTASMQQRRAAKPPHNCQGTGAAPACGTTHTP